MKHVNAISRKPQRAQTPDISLAAIFALLGDILFVLGTAVVAKEDSQFPNLTPPTTTR